MLNVLKTFEVRMLSNGMLSNANANFITSLLWNIQYCVWSR